MGPILFVKTTAILPPRASVSASDGLSFIPGPDGGGGAELVAQPHGGALRTSTPEARSKADGAGGGFS